MASGKGGSRIFGDIVGRLLDTPSTPPPGSGGPRGLRTVSKDMRLASDIVQSLAVPMITGPAATQAWLAAEAKGLQRHEIWALGEVFEDLAGMTLPKPER